MSDKFHQSLGSIINILKSSPISITIENIQRLSNIYKFETFIESINDDLKRLSIAGKILVIDIDYVTDRIVEQGINTMTFFTIKDIKLILANNYNKFNYFSNNENLLIHSLTQFDNLNKFNKILEKLTIFDQFSDDKLNLFEYYMNLYNSLLNKEIFNQKIELNYNCEFNILIDDFIILSFINDDKLSLDLQVNDIGLNLEFLTKDIIIPKNYLIEFNSLFIESKDRDIHELIQFKSNDNNSEIFMNNEKNLTLNILKFFTKELILVSSIFLNKLSIELIIKILNFNKLLKLLNELVEKKFEIINKYDKFNSVDFNLQLFKEFENGNDANKQDNYITISITEEYFKLKSNLQQFNIMLKFDDVEFNKKLNELSTEIETTLK